jgi:hypothetical protein
MKIAPIPELIEAGPKSEDNVHLVFDLDVKVIA